jgi:hydroxyacylglutathione hydrolase
MRAARRLPARARVATASTSASTSSTPRARRAMDVLQFPALGDNYGFAVRCRKTKTVALVDAPDEGAIARALSSAGWESPSMILNTHHHRDHVGANGGVRARFPDARVVVVAPRREAEKIGDVDVAVEEGDVVEIGDVRATVRETPGHTLGHVVYHFEEEKKVFVGDTMFALGCGRLFEGTPAMMWASMQKLLAMSDDTQVYCAHEYTQSNAKFALSVDPTNEALRARAREIDALRAKGEPTVPTTIGLERLTNPFCRPDSAGVQNGVNMLGSSDLAAVFGAVRSAKDNF